MNKFRTLSRRYCDCKVSEIKDDYNTDLDSEVIW